MAALIVFGLALLLFVGVAWMLSGGRQPSTITTPPDEPVVYVKSQPPPPPTAGEIRERWVWVLFTVAPLLGVMWVSAKAPETVLFTWGGRSVSLRWSLLLVVVLLTLLWTVRRGLHEKWDLRAWGREMGTSALLVGSLLMSTFSFKWS